MRDDPIARDGVSEVPRHMGRKNGQSSEAQGLLARAMNGTRRAEKSVVREPPNSDTFAAR
jgi:hypothetical protein